MPAAARLGDTCTGHGCWPPRASSAGSSNVFINGKPAHRVGDGWSSHCCPNNGCHSSALAAGSGSVFVNGAALGRVGDSVACGSAVASGSGNVFAG